MGLYLTDTNVLSELTRKAADPGVVAWFELQALIAVSAITLEELTFGLERLDAEQSRRLRRWYESFLQLPPEVIPVDEATARLAGQLRARRERAGKPATQADMLIAATALSTGRTLVTRNLPDFEGCGVPLLNPFSL